MSDRPRKGNGRPVSPATLVRYRADAERVLRDAENAGAVAAATSLASALENPAFERWFGSACASVVTPATWRRYRRALAVAAQELGLPDATRWAHLAAHVPGGRQRRRLDRPAGEGIRVAELRALRLQLQRSDDVDAQLAVDLVYACAATGVAPEHFGSAHVRGSGVHQLLVFAAEDEPRELRIGLLLPWLRERVLAACEAARAEPWRERLGAVRALLRTCGTGRVRRGQGYLTLEAAVAQYRLDAAASKSTAMAAAPGSKRSPRPTRARGRPPTLRTTANECLAQAEAVVRQNPPSDLSGGTAKEYWRETVRLMRIGDPALVWAAVADSRRPNVVRKRRAALHSTYRRMAWLLVHGASNGQAGAANQQRTMHLWPLLHTVMQAEPPSTHLLPPVAERKPRRSQRGLLVELPQQWQVRLINAVPAAIRSAVLVQAVTGCRPEELARGVRVEVEADQLAIEIIGAKVSRDAGWTRRTLRWSLGPARRVWNPLLAELRDMGPQTVRLGVSKRAYYQMVSRSGARLWPHLSRPLAPYALRHAVASAAKRARGRGDYVAQLLGHRSVRTQSTYGLWQLGSGTAGVLPDSVEVHAPEPPPSPPAHSSQPLTPPENAAPIDMDAREPYIADSPYAEEDSTHNEQMQAEDEQAGDDYPAPGM